MHYIKVEVTKLVHHVSQLALSLHTTSDTHVTAGQLTYFLFRQEVLRQIKWTTDCSKRPVYVEKRVVCVRGVCGVRLGGM